MREFPIKKETRSAWKRQAQLHLHDYPIPPTDTPYWLLLSSAGNGRFWSSRDLFSN